MRRSEKARLDNYVNNRDCEQSDWRKWRVERWANQLQADLLDFSEKEKLEIVGNALRSDSKDYTIWQEGLALQRRQKPRPFDVVLGRNPKSTDAVRGGVNQ